MYLFFGAEFHAKKLNLREFNFLEIKEKFILINVT